MLLSETYLTDNDKFVIEDYDCDFKNRECRVVLSVKDNDEVEPNIVFEIDFGDPKFEHHEETKVPFGSTYVTYEEEGDWLEDSDVFADPIKYELEMKEVTEEEFKSACGITDEELAELIDMCSAGVVEKAKEYAEENADEFDTSVEPDYDDSMDY